MSQGVSAEPCAPAFSLSVLILPTPPQQEEDDDSSSASDSDVLIQNNYERAEKRPILSVRKSRGSGLACASLWSPGSPSSCPSRDPPASPTPGLIPG